MTDKHESELKRKLLREGWTINERIEKAIQAKGVGYGSQNKSTQTKDLKECKIKGEEEENLNFEKSIMWDGLTKLSATWINNPDPEDIPKSPEWWDMLEKI